MRIVTRPDFDGVVCAVIFYEAENITDPVEWVEPNEMQSGLVEIREGDIISNLPYHEKCALWFDHHYSNRITVPFKGAFKIAPSAAGVAYKYYKSRLKRDYSELITQTDKIDSADLSLDEVLYPEKYAYVLLSMTILNRDKSDESYWNKLVELLGKFEIAEILDEPEVKQRCEVVIKENKKYKAFLKEHTTLNKHVSITDFRDFDEAPSGNRFLVYSLYPDSIVSVKIRYDYKDREKVILSAAHSLFNKKCNVNVGLMLSRFNGGGHRGAGGCSFHISKADEYISQILDILIKNETNEI